MQIWLKSSQLGHSIILATIIDLIGAYEPGQIQVNGV